MGVEGELCFAGCTDWQNVGRTKSKDPEVCEDEAPLTSNAFPDRCVTWLLDVASRNSPLSPSSLVFLIINAPESPPPPLWLAVRVTDGGK